MKPGREPNIMLCPLRWGMGHATRTEPIARMMADRGCNLFIAADPSILPVYDEDIAATRVPFSSIPIRYSRWLPASLAIILQIPVILAGYVSDRIRIGRLVKKFDIDILISDNRFGAFTHRCHSIYITHQLAIRAPRFLKFTGPLLSWMHRSIINRYDECWIPDLPPSSPSYRALHHQTIPLSGILSHPGIMPRSYIYTGILSRLSDHRAVKPGYLPTAGYTLLMLSGPEPQRSLLEKRVTEIFEKENKKLVIVAGKQGEPGPEFPSGSVTRYGYLGPAELRSAIENSGMIICRSGYSTVMELYALGRSALLVPTPGQTEQEYLAGWLSQNGLFAAVRQNSLSGELLKTEIPSGYGVESHETGSGMLEAAVERLLAYHHCDDKGGKT